MTDRVPSFPVAVAAVLFAVASIAGSVGARAGDVPLPSVPKAAGGTCLAPPDVMRREHMAMLMHGRDLTVRFGQRVAGGRLTACVSCHAVSDGKGGAVTVASPRHFCRTCHDYAAVKIDCFECHASRPEPGAARAEAQPATVDALLAPVSEIAR